VKLLSAILAALALCGASVASAAAAEQGMLDSEFGSGGKSITPVGLPSPWSETQVQLAAAPDGGSFVAAGTHLIAYRADGTVNPSFGLEGFVSLTHLPGNRRLELGDLAVDPEGRVLVFGTAALKESPPSRHSLAAVLRYLPDGELDPSFGDGDGIVMTDFGQRSSLDSPTAAVTASLGAVDRRGEITLVVGTMERVARCGRPPRLGERDRLVARLNSTGHLERFFGDDGVQRIYSLQTATSMSLSNGFEARLAGPLRSSCGKHPEFGVISIGADGARHLGFGDHGTRRLPGTVAAIAVDRWNRTVVLCEERQRKARNEHSTKVLRLLPDGDLDPDFSGGWIVYTFQGPLYRWSSLALDSQNRPVLVGTLVKPLQEGNATRFHRWLVVIPLRANGRLQSSFGWKGWLAISRFDPRSDAAASEALVDGEGRLLIAGTTRGPVLAPHGALALARFGLE
jgi:uncharacterized delta-60 repeat protein